MNPGDTFTHNGIEYTVTVVVSPTLIIAVGDNAIGAPNILKINPADI
jgi:hypothetical protein